MALAIVAGHCRGKRVRSSFETYAAQWENEGKWAPTLHSERKTGDLYNHMVIEYGVRSILTLQSEESPSTKTDDPPGLSTLAASPEGVHNIGKADSIQFRFRSPVNDINILQYQKIGASTWLRLLKKKKTTKTKTKHKKDNLPSWRIPETFSIGKFFNFTGNLRLDISNVIRQHKVGSD